MKKIYSIFLQYCSWKLKKKYVCFLTMYNCASHVVKIAIVDISQILFFIPAVNVTKGKR